MTNLEIDTWQKRETVRLGQIAKKKWLMEGDQNTKFFHSVINQRRKKAHISQMVQHLIMQSLSIWELHNISEISFPRHVKWCKLTYPT